jgi:cytochrome c oxidase subunit IV
MTDVEQDQQNAHGNHPGVGEYIEIATFLAVITAIEVALFYAGLARVVVVPALLFLTAMKFFLVVAWFMHLRFDHRLFRRVFVAGLLLAAVIFAVVIVIL